MTGEWCYGYYCEQHMPEYDNDLPDRVTGYTTLSVLFNDEPGQRRGGCYWTEVLYDTVGQFTGLLDKNGKEIYEGDIVKCGDFVYQVVYDGKRFASFTLHRKEDVFLHYFGEAIEAEDCEVIGNIHDNQELLKKRIRL